MFAWVTMFPLALLRMELNCMEAAASIDNARIPMAIKTSINEKPLWLDAGSVFKYESH